jgi:hypothetical protein
MPLQLWSLPQPNGCPCANDHPIPSANDSYYSPIQLPLTGLLEIRLQIDKPEKWKCPFGHCKSGFDSYSVTTDHINHSHADHEKFLFNEVGGFWAPLLCHLNRTGEWPKVSEIMFADWLELK